MSDYDPKALFELLQAFRSEEARRSRRNLSFISLTVIASQLLGLGINDIKPFGLDFSKANLFAAMGLGLAVLIYWAVIFRLTHIHDEEMQKEKELLLESRVKHYTSRLQKHEAAMKKNANYVPHDYPETKAFLSAYESQMSRTERASTYGKAVEKAEFYVPAAMFCIAVSILSWKLYVAL